MDSMENVQDVHGIHVLSTDGLLGSGNESVYKWTRSHDQDGPHGYK